MVPLGRLWFCRLTLEGNRFFSAGDRDRLVPFPPGLHRRLSWWLAPGRLLSLVPWVDPEPSVTVRTDASLTGWGFQASDGFQGQGLWTPELAALHINARELSVPLLYLRQVPSVRDRAIMFSLDNQVAVRCINRQGSPRSLSLQSVAEALFVLAHSRRLCLKASFLPGRANVWADALSRHKASSVEWSLTPVAFQDLVDLFGLPQVDLFASVANHRLPLFLSRVHRTPAGGPDAFLVDWSRWSFLYLFPPPASSVLLRVLARLRRFVGRVLLIAPLWRSQPWCQQLLLWCPSPLPLGPQALAGPGLRESGISSDFHAWSFSLRA